ncbi:Slx4p interacting protein [Serendipita sp. 400]|nr:Slx4p interacting protein [Serendipita sp. 400]
MTSKSLTGSKYPTFYACYLLKSLQPARITTRTYIGSTPAPVRRLRQHNGELQAGAQKTREGRPWEMVMLVHGFPSRLSALQFEWAWQHPNKTRHLKGDDGRAMVSTAYTLRGRVHIVRVMLASHPYSNWPLGVKFFSLEAFKAWDDAGKRSAPLPEGFYTSVELEGVDGTKEVTGSRSSRNGPIDINDSHFTARQLSMADALRRSSATHNCAICKDVIHTTRDDPMTIAICSAPTCQSVSHITCLATQFLSNEPSDLMIPRGGRCSECGQWTLWGDVVKGAYRRRDGGVVNTESDQSSDNDSDLDEEGGDTVCFVREFVIVPLTLFLGTSWKSWLQRVQSPGTLLLRSNFPVPLPAHKPVRQKPSSQRLCPMYILQDHLVDVLPKEVVAMEEGIDFILHIHHP